VPCHAGLGHADNGVMTEAHPVSETKLSARRAWIAVALTPFGVVAGLFVAYGVAAIMGVTLDPATGPGPTTTDKAIVFSIAGLVWLAPPTAAVVLAVRPAKSMNGSGIAALIVGALLFAGMLALTITNIAT